MYPVSGQTDTLYWTYNETLRRLYFFTSESGAGTSSLGYVALQ